MLADLKIAKEYDGFLFLAEATRNPPRLSSHRHVELELNLVVRGRITYVVGTRRYTFPVRTLIWLFPDQEHQLVNASDDFQCYVVVFRPGLIRDACQTKKYQGLLGTRIANDEVLHTQLEPQSFDLIRRTMDCLMPGSLDADLLNREAGFGPESNFIFTHKDRDGLNAGLRHLMLLCWRSNTNGKVLGDSVTLHPSVRTAIEIMSGGDGDESLPELASQCGVSSAYLSKTFHRQIGVTLTRYRNSLRLSRFWESFKNADKRSVTESAYAAGFGSYAQFYKTFVQAYGHGPRLASLSDSL